MLTAQAQQFLLDYAEPIPESGCWLFSKATDPRGYGRIAPKRFVPFPNKVAFAHRVSYALAYGPIPDGMLVCHRCDVPACVNPSHLFLGTNDDNMRDAASKGRFATGNKHRAQRPNMPSGDRHWSRIKPSSVPRGEVHCHAKLNAQKVIAILKDQRSLRAIAKSYGVSYSSVHAVKQRKVWKHVQC